MMESNEERFHAVKYLWFRNMLIHSGDSIFLFPLLLLLFFLTGSELSNLFGATLVTMAITGLTVGIIKNWVRKERPKGDFGSLYRKYDPYAFPSGHAARSFAIVTIVAGFGYLLPALLLLGWASWISWIRVHLGLHHWPDIWMGILTGFTMGVLLLVIRQYLYPIF